MPSTLTHFRPAEREDLASVEALLTASGLPTAGVADSFDEFVVAESGGQIVGVVGMEYHGRYALLRSTAVAEDFRGLGIARALITHALADAERREMRAVYLLTTTAKDYFPSFGFAAVPRDSVPAEIKATSEFSTICSTTATVMCKPVSKR